MKKIAILGFNVFAPGGTSRSNINLLEEFGRAGYQITFFNFRQFTRRDLRKLKKENPTVNNVEFLYVADLETHVDFDYFFITRESFFCVAPYIRANSNAIIVGEIHTPLALIEETDLTDYLQYFSCVRVATESIKAEIMRRFHYDRVYVQTVSLEHIANEQAKFDPEIIDENGNVNLIVRSRFDHEKDISAIIKLLDYMVHYLQHDEFRLYITGYGPSGKMYENLVSYYGLEDYVLFNNKVVPERHIYMSTSFYETFGYSIVEEFASGHPVIAYPGKDNVTYENFGAFKDVLWIKKDPEVDAPKILDFIKQPRTVADYQHNLEQIAKKKQHYVANFEATTAKFKQNVGKVNNEAVTYAQTWAVIQKRTKFDGMRRFRRVYYKVRKVPAVGAIVQQDWIRVPAMKLLGKFVGETPDFTSDEPIDENKFFIESFHGSNLSGDPKYFALEVQRNNPDAEIFVSSRNQLVDMEILANGFTPIRVGSLRYIEKFQECKYVFINGNSLDKAGKRAGQVFIQTWHGFPMKQMVNDLADDDQRKKESEAFAPRMQKWDYLTTSSAYNVDLLKSAFRLDDNLDLKVFDNGTPKNEYLLKNSTNTAEKQRIFEKYFNRPYDASKKIVLFCPTWRKGKRKDVSDLDLQAVMQALPEDYLMIVKLHPLESHLRQQYADLDPRIFCFYNELVDIQELYILSDLLISDYSSAIFDYSLLNKPIVVMQEDEAEYAQNIGWYFNIEDKVGLHAENYDTNGLVQAILKAPDTTAASKLIKERLLTNEHVGSTDESLKIIMSQSESD